MPSCFWIFLVPYVHCFTFIFRDVRRLRNAFRIHHREDIIGTSEDVELLSGINLVRTAPDKLGEYYYADILEQTDFNITDNIDPTPSFLLESRVNYTTFTSADIRLLWEQHCSSNNLTDMSGNATLNNVLPLLFRSDAEVIVEGLPTEMCRNVSDDEIYVSEQELNRKWFKRSLEPLGKPLEQFSIEEALQLVEDEDEDEMLLRAGLPKSEIVSQKSTHVADIVDVSSDKDEDENDVVMADGSEYVVTLDVRLSLLLTGATIAAWFCLFACLLVRMFACLFVCLLVCLFVFLKLFRWLWLFDVVVLAILLGT